MSEVWKLLAGVAIFLLGMNILQEGLRALTGRRFKLFLRRQTLRPLNGIAGGAIISGLLQSSSVVGLVVLALVGAGTLPMRNALAVVMGANLGTTLNTWVVAIAGFRLDIELFALPAIAIGGIARLFSTARSGTDSWLGVLLGIGLMFFALDQMKEGMESTVSAFDFSVLEHYPAIAFAAAGLLITSLVQSSSATIAITLAALHAGALTLPAAMAVVLGSEVGTTVKLLLASSGKEAAMKRLALGNFLFNLGSSCIFLLFLVQTDRLISNVLGVRDSMVALSLFQTLLNFISIIIFFPFLKVFARFLESRFTRETKLTRYISNMPIGDSELALQALKEETSYFLRTVLHFGTSVLDADGVSRIDDQPDREFAEKDLAGKYAHVKQLHGDVHNYYRALRPTVSDKEASAQLDQLISAVQNGMYAAKNFKDASPDVSQLRNSGNETKYRFYQTARQQAEALSVKLAAVLKQPVNASCFEELVTISRLLQSGYTAGLKQLYTSDSRSELSSIELSTIINFNREIYTAFKALLFALKDTALSKEEAGFFDELPVFSDRL